MKQRKDTGLWVPENTPDPKPPPPFPPRFAVPEDTKHPVHVYGLSRDRAQEKDFWWNPNHWIPPTTT